MLDAIVIDNLQMTLAPIGKNVIRLCKGSRLREQESGR
jgi:hypothetical protein